ncbi:MAG: nodulation factor ABC transporter ATP-binding protein NodI [Azospira oryzae]|nr:MAG: nodulation factor ABC transporter ATP-binding protein NodI [Azospira oryzae]PZP78169.1 MAG: nodulation factor ABC transporter ATP-binding protein NodI [Azospira oryzae]
MQVLTAQGLRKFYGAHEVVRGVDLTVQRGQCFGLLGPNGAGKTTTLRLCLGLTDPDGGKIHLLGEPVPQRAREARIRVGVVPQSDNLDPDFTVVENLLVFGRYFGLDRKTVARRVPELLAFAGLEGRADTKIQTLSGGMKRRLALARALVNDPDLLFLDEPTTGLDPQARHLIWERLKQLLALGKTIVLTTHFMDEAERLCDTLSVMDHGRIIAHGSPRALIRQNIEREVVEVYGEGAQAWARLHAPRLCQRFEIAGETAFCYCEDAKPVIADLEGRNGLRYLHRPANLEDVFLKLTGRDIRD